MHGLRAEAWNRSALQPPRAHGTPLPAATLKAAPEDFHVEERLSFEPSGNGPHWLLRIEKRTANTRWVAAEIARLAGVAAGDVGYAGLKDRQAVAVQWFSVPAAGKTADFWSGVRTNEFKVLQVHANLRKLRIGALSGNRFRVRLRDVTWSREQLDSKLESLRAHGVPNYFGPQRFGREGYNLDRIAAWLQSATAPRGRAERSFTLSAARSLVFNAVLARRVQAGDWSQLAPGDLASLDGSGSHFAVTAVDDELRRRLAEFDVHASGPLWGRGQPASQGYALQHELAVASELGAVTALLAGEGLSQERRALRCAVRELTAERDVNTLTLSFSLGRDNSPPRCCARSANFRAPRNSRPTRSQSERPCSIDVEHRFAPAQPASFVGDDHQQAVAALRQLRAGQVQALLRNRNPVGDALGDVHGDQADIADAERIRPDGRAAGRNELQLNIERRRQGFSERRRKDPDLRIVRVVVRSGAAGRRSTFIAQIARAEVGGCLRLG